MTNTKRSFSGFDGNDLFYRVKLKDLCDQIHTIAWYEKRQDARERLGFTKSVVGSRIKVWIEQVKVVDGVRCIKVVR